MICDYRINDIEVHKYIMPIIDSNMYILLIGDMALIIDPHKNEDARNMLERQNVKRVSIFLTHEHFDHISGVNYYKDLFPCIVYGNEQCKERATDPSKNLSYYHMATFMDKPEEEYQIAKELFDENYGCKVDESFGDEKRLLFNDISIRLISTPGHSPGSICILIEDLYMFTGDTIVDGKRIITKLPGGSRKDYAEITKPYLESLDLDIIVFPGHGKEKRLQEFDL